MVKTSKSEKETHKIAGKLAEKIMKGPSTRLPPTPRLWRAGRASVITLEGELGAGKTTFVKGFARALGVKAKIKSPTFVLMRYYPITNYALCIKRKIRNPQSAIRKLYHLDCYRVRDHKDLATLDLKSLFKLPDNIVLVEWPERVSKILPKKLIKVHIDHIDRNKRKIKITNY